MKDTYSIYDMLDAIRARPGMYAGGVDLNNIKTYIHGYQRAMDDAEITDVSKPEFKQFHEFVRAKYNYNENTAGWANMIKAIILGLNPKQIRWKRYDSDITIQQQEQALERFYELLDEFRSNSD